MKKILSLILVAVMLFSFVGVLASCDTRETLTVYTESGFAPFEYVSGGMPHVPEWLYGQELEYRSFVYENYL